MSPQATLATVLGHFEAHADLFPQGPDRWPVKLLSWRGYYLDSEGRKGQNDRNIYDDALFLVTPTHFSSYRANNDPSVRRAKVATLEAPQFIAYKKGMHRANSPSGHMAYRQASPVIVRRDDYVKPKGYRDNDWGISIGGGLWTDKGFSDYFWTNLHKGGRNTTSSLGCQTIHPDLWAGFFTAVSNQLTEHSVSLVGCILINDPRMS